MLILKKGFTVGPKVYRRGQVFDPKDPIVKGRESLFGSLEGGAVERATAGPGERRNVTPPKPKKKAPAKKAPAKKAPAKKSTGS